MPRYRRLLATRHTPMRQAATALRRVVAARAHRRADATRTREKRC